MSFSVTSATSGRDYLMSKNLNLQLAVAFRIVVVNYAAILFILSSFRPLSVTDFMWVHFLSSPDQRFGFAFLAAAYTFDRRSKISTS